VGFKEATALLRINLETPADYLIRLLFEKQVGFHGGEDTEGLRNREPRNTQNTRKKQASLQEPIPRIPR
jgi:hypothetical protein